MATNHKVEGLIPSRRTILLKKDFIMDKTIFKKTGEELQEFLKFRKRGSKVKAKKGKGSFSRKQKHKNKICGIGV